MAPDAFCGLCGGMGLKRNRNRAVVGFVCVECLRSVCARHGRYVDGQPMCVRCLGDKPAEVQASALALVS